MNGELKKIPLANIRPNPNNSRREVRGPGFESFKENLRAQGQMQPGVARPHPDGGEVYELLCGHRRFAALQDIGAATMDLVIRDATDQEALVVLASENLQREDLTHLEEGEDVRKLLSSGMDHKAVAAALGKSLAWVYRRDRLNELHPTLRSMAADPEKALSRLSVECLEELGSFPLDVQERWVKGRAWILDRDDINLETVRKFVAQDLKLLGRAPFDVGNADLVPSAGACTACPKRSSCSAGVFGLQDLEPGEVGKRDQCLDGACWNAKVEAFRDNKLESVRKDKPGIRLLMPKNGNEAFDKKAKFKGLVESWDWQPAKKNTPGAVEGFILFGDEAGKVVWAKIYNEEGRVKTAAPKGEAAKEMTPKEKAQALAHNRQILEFRRQARALENLAEHLINKENRNSLAQNLDLVEVLGLAEMFGWGQAMKASAAWDGKGLRKLYEQERKVEDMIAAVLPPMAQRLFVMKSTEASDRQAAHAEFYCELFNLSWAGFLSEAAKEIKEPKAWAELEAPAPAAVEKLKAMAEKSRTEKTPKPKPKGKAKLVPKDKKARLGLQLQDKEPVAKPKAGEKRGGGK